MSDKRIISEAEYQFVSEMDGLRAIALLLRRQPDPIFLDLVMSNTNGYEICLQLPKLSGLKNTPTIVVTGNNGIIHRDRAKIAGANFVSKSAKPKQILKIIDKHLVQKRKNDT